MFLQKYSLDLHFPNTVYLKQFNTWSQKIHGNGTFNKIKKMGHNFFSKISDMPWNEQKQKSIKQCWELHMKTNNDPKTLNNWSLEK